MMEKRDYVEFQRRTEPLAFLITFRCYGAIDYVINGQGDDPFEL
jgi:hypothetical protein